MKGLIDCFAYRIAVDAETKQEIHSCSCLDHTSIDKPQCVGERKPNKCSFFKTRADANESTYRSALRCIKLGYPIDKHQSEQLKKRRQNG